MNNKTPFFKRGEKMNYFEFTPGEKKYLEEINESFDSQLSKYATKNSDAKRFAKKPRHDIIRPPYSYDVDCIIYNPFYNRYTDKTQVFSFYKNDDVTRRALHVQLVSKIAKTIGRALRLNLDLIEAIALGHDMGHTPFGHKGEEFLSECYSENTAKHSGVARYFNHNVHSARIFRHILDTDLTLQTLSGIIAHNGERICREYTPSKIDTFKEFDSIMESCYLENNFHKSLRPNTLEGCVVRISDMIAYAGKDRQDLYRVKLITDESFKTKRLIGTRNSDIISNVIINIIKNSIDSPSLNMDTEVFEDLRDLIAENTRLIYLAEDVKEPYHESIQPLMKKLYMRLYSDVEERNFKSPIFVHYLNDFVLGESYRNKATRKIVGDTDEIVTDFIAAMTDDYFVDICNELHIDDDALAHIKYHSYFE